MLVEFWECLRGYDKWIPAEARVATVSQVRKLFGALYRTIPDVAKRTDLLVWVDSDGKPHCGAIAAHEFSPVYQLIGATQLKSATIHTILIAITAERFGKAGRGAWARLLWLVR